MVIMEEKAVKMVELLVTIRIYLGQLLLLPKISSRKIIIEITVSEIVSQVLTIKVMLALKKTQIKQENQLVPKMSKAKMTHNLIRTK